MAHMTGAEQAVTTWIEALPRGDEDASTGSVADAAAEVMAALAELDGAGEHRPDGHAHEHALAAGRRVARVLRARGVPPSRIAQALGALRDVVTQTGDGSVVDAASLERRLGTLTAAVAQAIAEEEARARRELEGTLDIFTRTLAHELKNPIGAAEGAAQMLLDEVVVADERQRRRFAEMVVRNLKRAADLVNDLRLLVMARSGDRVDGRPRSVRTIVDEVTHEVTDAARERGIEVTVVEPLPDARVDSARTTLVLMNLVWNAIKYSDRDKVQRWVRVGVALTPDGDWHCWVADNGVGIPADAQDRVFERFQRLHPNLAMGTGLGLSIAREAVTQLGGRMWLESDEGLGTTFHFTVPSREMGSGSHTAVP